MVDFGVEHSFAKAVERLKEHYHIEVPKTGIYRQTIQHAKKCAENLYNESSYPKVDCADQLIAQSDGSLIRVVETGSQAGGAPDEDRRKHRACDWKEVQLQHVYRKGEVKGLFLGEVGQRQRTGDQLQWLGDRSGMGKSTRIHGVGDGATWIQEQFDRAYGSQGSFLIDFYHLGSYLDAAAPAVAGNQTSHWLERQRKGLKENRLQELLEELRPHLEPESQDDSASPVRCAHRYMTNRPGQFDDARALAQDLPIGSGRIESAHRYVVQERLKIPGASWKPQTAKALIDMRCLRENRQWNV